ncbi:hypothetical protein [Nonomuraea endophytica]|uniref:Uncharacterized protein n=1 Tax=Nonomuraea endophytica TaxID=714136 RepID=A0A7W8AA20_9ACTN|nr:hypothetical protein [Nonomuraea endophytica]MBB5081351.1 hypothetical protein [Nonomuraea endophytica]
MKDRSAAEQKSFVRAGAHLLVMKLMGGTTLTEDEIVAEIVRAARSGLPS